MFFKFSIPALQIFSLRRMIGRMNDEFVKRYSLAEIALLIIFMLGLVIAWAIVKARHKITLSEPIPLTGAGLAVSMPVGPGWEFEASWRYESDSSMVLIAQQQTRRIRKASVRWRYDIISPGGTAEDILRQRVRQSDSDIGPIQTISGPVPMTYALIRPESADMAFYLGVVPLDFNRHLELQIFVYQQFDFSYAETLLHSLANSIQYESPEPLRAGRELLGAFWEAMQSNALALADKDDQAFLIKNTQNQPVGYGFYQYSNIGTNSETQWQVRGRHYEHNRSLIETTFLYDGSRQRFTWKTTIRQAGMGSPREYTLVRETDGTVSVRSNIEEQKQFTSDALLPELLLAECTALFREGERQRVVVDVVSPTGFVVPTVLEKFDVRNASVRAQQAAFAVKVDFLNNPNSFEELYFDENSRLIGRFERQPVLIRLWERTTAERLEQIFEENFQAFNGTVAAVK